MARISRIQHFNIYSDSNGSYIVHNTRKEFSEGHTHINNFNTAKYITYLALYKRLPKKGHLSLYLIESVIRISDDSHFINKMNDFKNRELRKKNRQK